MKTKLFGWLMCMVFSIGYAMAQDAATATFSLEGDEGACGPFDEAIQEGEGIVSTDFNMLTNELEVVYNPDEISLDEVKNKLGEKGYLPAEEVMAREDAPETDVEEIAMACKFEEHKDREQEFDDR